MIPEIHPRRRTIIVGAGLGAVAGAAVACSNPPGTSSSPGAAEGADAPTTGPLAKTSAVPVGSALIVGDVVVTQPTAGKFEGFSSRCPHAGCKVSEVADGKIICPCHGSKFNLDGTVSHGPAKSPLESKSIKVQGDSIVAG